MTMGWHARSVFAPALTCIVWILNEWPCESDLAEKSGQWAFWYLVCDTRHSRCLEPLEKEGNGACVRLWILLYEGLSVVYPHM